MNYHVRIAKERLVFSAAHFITYGDDTCEPLHGHNYHVAAEVAGALNENHYVVDFIYLRDMLQELVDGLDHRMLLPMQHPTIHVVEAEGPHGTEVIAVHGERRWVFPRGDCLLLPLANTTAELLAHYLACQVESRLPKGFTRIRIEVDECDGQWGVCETTPS